ncbi:MAG: sporulation protein YtfJ [Ruminococcaceae bacterium]|nr:sporulation protein YtfJ [Oscillospiraceae bacterium]
MAEHPIKGLMETAMSSIKEMVDVNTIVGSAVNAPDGTLIIPISKVSFGFGAGGSEFGERSQLTPETNANFGGGSGGGAVIEPVAFMVVGQGQIRLMPMDKETSPVEDIIEKVPTLIDKVAEFFKKKDKKEQVTEEVYTAETVAEGTTE